MSLIKFEDYPSTNTPISAENLNNNFDEVVLKTQILNEKTESDKDTYSCDYINGINEWKYLGKSTGIDEMQLPNNWNELDCMMIVKSNVAAKDTQMLVHINKLMLNQAALQDGHYTFGCSSIPMGGDANASTVQGGSIFITPNNTIRVNYVPGSTNSAELCVYYK